MRASDDAAIGVQRDRQRPPILPSRQRELDALPIEISARGLVVDARAKPGLNEVTSHIGMQFDISSADCVVAGSDAAILSES